jgi:hypothetical protein
LACAGNEGGVKDLAMFAVLGGFSGFLVLIGWVDHRMDGHRR